IGLIVGCYEEKSGLDLDRSFTADTRNVVVAGREINSVRRRCPILNDTGNIRVLCGSQLAVGIELGWANSILDVIVIRLVHLGLVKNERLFCGISLTRISRSEIHVAGTDLTVFIQVIK